MGQRFTSMESSGLIQEITGTSQKQIRCEHKDPFPQHLDPGMCVAAILQSERGRICLIVEGKDEFEHIKQSSSLIACYLIARSILLR